MGCTKYFLPREVAAHNKPEDMWLSFLGKVYNVTPLYYKYKGHMLLKPIIAEAGKDISHWFDPVTKDLRKHVDPITGIRKYYTPHGRFLHVPPPFPRSDHITDLGRPWWRDSAYEIGLLAQKTRLIYIVNTLTLHEHVLQVCSEENIKAILQRYLHYNAHAASYTWKYKGEVLDMEETLEDNGVVDEGEDFYTLRMDAEKYLQTIHLYFNDDLTIA
uniref:cytochrome b5 domain-containing protein 1 n=1 Tax=Myxine glutinosa TaxID=7769 RepID=UPI00358E2C9D